MFYVLSDVSNMLPEASLTGSVALHSGYSEHPQNSEPARVPLRAVRLRIGLPHSGQSGVGSVSSPADSSSE